MLTLVAIIDKQACSLAIFDKTTNRMATRLGMIPRGEVIMVIVTTLVTPPALKMSLLRGQKS